MLRNISLDLGKLLLRDDKEVTEAGLSDVIPHLPEPASSRHAG
jgi:hypothetical protein